MFGQAPKEKRSSADANERLWFGPVVCMLVPILTNRNGLQTTYMDSEAKEGLLQFFLSQFQNTYKHFDDSLLISAVEDESL